MKLRYGSYEHADAECNVSIQTRNERDSESGFIVELRQTWNVTGVLHGDNFADLTQKIRALEEAYSTDGGSLVLVASDGTESAHSITNGSVRIVEPPSFPTSDGAEYHGGTETYRTFTIVLEG